MDFDTKLFAEEQCSMEGRKELLEGLSQLSEGEKDALHFELTLEELTIAVNQLASRWAPGIDGISTDFKHFCNILGPDLHSVLLECFTM